MALPINITFNVAPLPDADVWFANAAAWLNYWKEVQATGSIEGAATTAYVPSPYDNTLVPAAFNVSGIDYICATVDMFNSLMQRLDTLEASYRDLRQQLADAGLISTV